MADQGNDGFEDNLLEGKSSEFSIVLVVEQALIRRVILTPDPTDNDFENGYLESNGTESDDSIYDWLEERLSQAMLADTNEQDDDGDESPHAEQSTEASGRASADPPLLVRSASQTHPRLINYDRNLAAQHTYLGLDLEEVACSKLLDEGAIVSLPLLSIDSVVLVPGQTLPLRIQHPIYALLLQTISKSNRLFGLYNRSDEAMNNFMPGASHSVGTTAEIRNYAEEDGTRGIVVRLKVLGRQRFQVQKTWVDESGVLIGKLLILPEVHEHGTCVFGQNAFGRAYGRREKVLRNACTPLPSFVYDLYDPDILMGRLADRLSSWTRAAEQKVKRPSRTERSDSTESVELVHERTEVHETIGETDASVSRTVGAEGDGRVQVTRTVVTRVRERPSSTSDEQSSSDESEFCAPTEPAPFSYWIISNLPIQDSYRIQALILNSVVQRLRLEVSIMSRCLYIYCKRCEACFCRREDVFSMSATGPQASYVNQRGMVFDLFTVYTATALKAISHPTTNYTWFPGYAWIIATCSSCHVQIGFKFVATNKSLKPESFWGLSRNSVNSWKSTTQKMLVF
jgi:cereblon